MKPRGKIFRAALAVLVSGAIRDLARKRRIATPHSVAVALGVSEAEVIAVLRKGGGR